MEQQASVQFASSFIVSKCEQEFKLIKFKLTKRH